MKNITHNLSRMSVTVTDIDVKIKTQKGTFTFGVDNDGQPYICTGVRRILVVPSASNRMNVFEEGTQ